MRMEGLLVFGITPQHPHASKARIAFYGDLLDRLGALPDVESVTMMVDRLGSGWSENDQPTLDGVTHSWEEIPLRANLVGPGYLHTLGPRCWPAATSSIPTRPPRPAWPS